MFWAETFGFRHKAQSPNLMHLETTGEVSVEEYGDDSNRCGLRGSPTVIGFHVTLTSCPERLNGKGFIVDWQDVHKYFHETYRKLHPFVSCETIADKACRDLATMLSPSVLAIVVRIGASTAPANVRASWTHPEAPKYGVSVS